MYCSIIYIVYWLNLLYWNELSMKFSTNCYAHKTKELQKVLYSSYSINILILCLLNVLLTKEEIIIKPKMLFFPKFF